MELNTAIRLIEKGVASNIQQTWADLGAGTGLFTNALATVLPKGSTVYAIDKDSTALKSIVLLSADIILQKIQTDFSTTELEIGQLDGVLMANSLHFIPDKESFLHRLKKNLKPISRIIIVEYDSNRSNRWVPYPIPYTSLQKLFHTTGFTTLTKIGEVPSLYDRGNLYAALATQ